MKKSEKAAGDVQALMTNGLEFLERAREEIDTSPKDSVVCFWTGVELLLKVPLLQEHWTLVCSNSGKGVVSRADYLRGNFQSVSFEKTCNRLKKVLELPIPDKTKALLKTVSDHRNRVVHFYHDGLMDKARRGQILKEQAEAWFALNRIIRDGWNKLENHHLERQITLQETRLLTGNTYYAEVKFRTDSPELQKRRQAGETIKPCPTCHCVSAVISPRIMPKDTHRLTDIHCLVCFHCDLNLEFRCPECDTETRLVPGEEDFTCPNPACGHTETRFDLLQDIFHKNDEWCLAPVPADCEECGGVGSVCEFSGGYLCTHCFDFSETLPGERLASDYLDEDDALDLPAEQDN